jgi:hypothetical protein
MDLVNQLSNVIIFITIIIFIVSSITTTLGTNSKLYLFLDTFSKSSVIYIAGGVFLTYIFFKHNLDESKRTTTLKIQERSYLDVIKAIHEYRPKAPRFMNSLYLKWQKSNLVEDYSGANDEWGTKLYISKLIFQSIEDMIDVWGSDKTELTEWIATFIPWLHGKEMQQFWSLHKYSSSPSTTIPFIDYLIKHINSSKLNNGDQLVKLARKFSNDKYIIDILNTSRLNQSSYK